jgi:hypothetical protein
MPAGQPDRSLGAELRAPTRYTDGSTDETSEALDLIADLAASRVCRECEALFIPAVRSDTKWGTVCGPCLRAMGCLP